DPMTTFAELAEANPNIREQYDIWREERSNAGEDAVDWEAFRQHVLAIGAPDPGDWPPDDFVGDDFKAANPDWTQRWFPNWQPSSPPPAIPKPDEPPRLQSRRLVWLSGRLTATGLLPRWGSTAGFRPRAARQ